MHSHFFLIMCNVFLLANVFKYIQFVFRFEFIYRYVVSIFQSLNISCIASEDRCIIVSITLNDCISFFHDILTLEHLYKIEADQTFSNTKKIVSISRGEEKLNLFIS